uniref:Splicing factor, putative n=1 Tax=Arundo donax TaxID=35708 RepID=A0A0A9FSJ3_ARUDO
MTKSAIATVNASTGTAMSDVGKRRLQNLKLTQKEIKGQCSLTSYL